MRRRTNLYKIVDQDGKQVFEDLLTAKQVTEKTGCTKNKSFYVATWDIFHSEGTLQL